MTFFSGTDTATLQEEGNERNHFVSLIVNNAGKYTAAITRKIKYTAIRESSYEGFGGTVTSPEKETIEGSEIEYFYLDIVFEGEVSNKANELSERLNSIKTKKATLPKISYPTNEPIRYGTYGVNTGITKTPQPTLFNDFDFDPEPKSEVKIDDSVEIPILKEDVEGVINQLITGCVLLKKLDNNIKAKLIKNIDERFDKRFGKEDTALLSFEYWATDFIEYLLWYSLGYLDVDEYDATTKLAEGVYAELETFPKSKYIEKFKELILKYVDRF